MSFEIHVAREKETETRLRISGTVDVRWRWEEKTNRPVPDVVDASNIQIVRRSGTPLFSRREPVVLRKGGVVGSLVVYDLDRNGYPDVLLGGANLLLMNREDSEGRRFQSEPLFPGKPIYFTSLVVADFNGDGVPDAIGARQGHAPRLYLGNGEGGFGSPRRIQATGKLEGKPAALSAGDINGDGHLDLYIGQWRSLFALKKDGPGGWPKRYFDATDGHPDYVLLNDGTGRFKDVSEKAGLGAKRRRRTLSACLIDLNRDGHPDLVQVNDFAGVDAFLNDGKGNFRDVTDEWFDARHLFGMSQTYADFNRDGRLDLYTVGMSAPTVRRLDRMGVGPKGEFARHTAMREAMTYGNRLYFRKKKRFVQPSFARDVARSAWSWGSTTLDFNNDRYPDIYVGSGCVSGASTADYSARFWTKDIYRTQAVSEDSTTRRALRRVAGRRMSLNGRLPNRLFVNRGGEGFQKLGYVVGLGRDWDARNVVSADMDADGLQDLIVGSVGKRGKLHLIPNTGEAASGRHWIGVRLRPGEDNVSPIGARVVVRDSKGKHVQRIVTGDSYKSQHPATVHFGLGRVDTVETIRVAWPGGPQRTVRSPAVDRYHVVRPNSSG